MTPEGTAILDNLTIVSAERRRRTADLSLAERVAAVKRYQHRRFTNSYADLLASARFGRAARFFLDDLYGPHDFGERDEQFVRVVPALVRLFPAEIVQTVLWLAQLHALSEKLDSKMGEHLATTRVDPEGYISAWQAGATPAERERQIILMLAVGAALDRYTRNPLLRHTLRLMRGPARAAGMGALQGFLESGFETFKEMGGAREFLDTVASRERALAAELFSAEAGDPALIASLPAAED